MSKEQKAEREKLVAEYDRADAECARGVAARDRAEVKRRRAYKALRDFDTKGDA